jgi:hypothetical protein
VEERAVDEPAEDLADVVDLAVALRKDAVEHRRIEKRALRLHAVR